MLMRQYRLKVILLLSLKHTEDMLNTIPEHSCTSH